VSKSPFSGKIIVTGIGKVDEDEFMLNLLNEQVQFLTPTLQHHCYYYFYYDAACMHGI
jgi:hypothetical protein